MNDIGWLAVGVPGGEFLMPDGTRLAQVIVNDRHWELSPTEYHVWLDCLTGSSIENPLLRELQRHLLVIAYNAADPDTAAIRQLTIVPNGVLVGNRANALDRYFFVARDNHVYPHAEIDAMIWSFAWHHQSLQRIIDLVSASKGTSLSQTAQAVWNFVGCAMQERLIYLVPFDRRAVQ